jgi:hypothetical protein
MKMSFLTLGPRTVVRLLKFWEGFQGGVHYPHMYTKKFQVYRNNLKSYLFGGTEGGTNEID